MSESDEFSRPERCPFPEKCRGVFLHNYRNGFMCWGIIDEPHLIQTYTNVSPEDQIIHCYYNDKMEERPIVTLIKPEEIFDLVFGYQYVLRYWLAHA